ncbi:hypothetical protein B0H11DRAFT_2228379 [Mycena galericulata]|nr:hypothetical protein B0H11DRAFT_2228379 [Mycena galericulata]
MAYTPVASPVILPTLQSVSMNSSHLNFIDNPAFEFLGARSHPSIAAFLVRSAEQLTHLSLLVFPDERTGAPRYAFLERVDLLPRLGRLPRISYTATVCTIFNHGACAFRSDSRCPRHAHLHFLPPMRDILRDDQSGEDRREIKNLKTLAMPPGSGRDF